MKKIVGVIIITLFLIPFLFHSVRYFKESASQKKIVSEKKQPVGGASKVPVVPALLKIPKEASVSAQEVKSKEKNGEPNIHDQILTYRLNSKDHIKQIQASLKKAGFYKGEIDGKLGPRTRRAIKEFQKAKKLNPDGVVGSKTWEALNQ